MAIAKFRESLKLQPQAPHTYFWMAMTYYFNMQQRDSAYYYIQKASQAAPAWRLPKATEAMFLSIDRKFIQAKSRWMN
ncbi:MAG: hypothetical protein IPM82_23975 [Saprospiraceae bacterium]|nr:hypothetical protein [Saprospiraceae bacterium]